LIEPLDRRALILAGAAARPAVAQERTEPAQEAVCKCRPERVGPCFTVRGRIALYQRAPTVRITVDSTKRVLGLEGGVPEFLEEDLEPHNVVTGEFVVCPVTRAKRGTIQLVCIESSSNLVVSEKR